jgi:hypothetical protein
MPPLNPNNSFSGWWLTELNLAFCTESVPVPRGWNGRVCLSNLNRQSAPRATGVAHDLPLQSR